AGLIESSLLGLAFGMVALLVAMGEIVYAMVRRDISRSSLGLIGLALVIFNLIAMEVVVIGRADHFRALPGELAAPRYFFHSTLFWTCVLAGSRCAPSSPVRVSSRGFGVCSSASTRSQPRLSPT